MATSLPLEIIVNVLSRLTVKDLLRLRSVCRAWRSLIDSPNFIKLHLSHSMETATNLGLVLKADELYWVDAATFSSPLRLHHPIDDGGGGVEVLGCCNGVLALLNSSGVVALWNPSTRRYRKLPISHPEHFPFPVGVFEFSTTGFGYDSVNDDYKFLRMLPGRKDDILSLCPDVKLYSVKAKTWKTVNGFPSYYGYQAGIGIFVNGALHWLVCQEPNSYCFIVGFDLVTEEHREVLLPFYQDGRFYIKLVELGGCLSLVKNYRPEHKNSERAEIWVMKEYGVQESWTKLFSVVPSDVSAAFDYALPVLHLKSSDQVVMNLGGEKFAFYDMERKRIENVTISGTPNGFKSCVCVGSLVGFDGGDGEKTAKPKQQQGRKKRDDFLSKGFKLVL